MLKTMLDILQLLSQSLHMVGPRTHVIQAPLSVSVLTDYQVVPVNEQCKGWDT